jgi:two-component system sensor histidine kinase MtrB
MTRRRLGLRARVITAFAIGALLLSALLSVVTYSVTRANLIESREQEALINAENAAKLVNGGLSAASDVSSLVTVMSEIIVPSDTLQGMLYNASSQFVDTTLLTEEKLDPSFVLMLRAGSAAVMTFEINDEPHYVVGLPLPRAQANASYIQAAPLTEVEQDLNALLPTLVGASAMTAILGMGFGVWVSKRLLTPINEISDAAGLVAAGDLSTRLESGGDPDLDQLIQSFNGMTSSLQERVERDSRFASDVSHELRSPLMTLTGSVALLERRRDDMPERAQLALDLLSTDIRRFKLLVEDLLEISRFDVGAVQLDNEEVMLGEFVRQAISAAVARERDVPIIHNNGTNELFVELDKRRIAQVIRNLSENADKYAGGVTQIRLERTDDDIRIEIEDEGPGVPIDERELIFERFARGSEGGRRGSGTGVGLGLSLVTEHLRLQGGTISVADRVDGLLGSRFVISLPGVVVQ